MIGFERREHFRFVLDPLGVGAFGDAKVMSKMSLPCLVLFAYFVAGIGVLIGMFIVAGFLSTHPADATRIRQIEAWLPEAAKYYQPGS